MIKLYLAPMEELTGYVFRNTLAKHFGCVDKYFTPFISPDNRIMKTRSSREITPSNNEGLTVVPQLLTNDFELFNEGAGLIADFGYKEININFGCPSNTVAAKYKGSGILRSPELMERLLDGIFNGPGSVLNDHSDLHISVKTRVGFNDTSDFEKVTEILNRFPFSEIIVHPRLKKDLYNGSARMEMFDMACDRLKGNIVYNGDIYTAEDFINLTEKYGGKITAVMIGRGAVINPGIFRQIRTGKVTAKAELYDFLTDLFESYRNDCGAGNALAKMKEVWSYTTCLIEDEKTRRQVFKEIIKAKHESEYKDAILSAKDKLPMHIPPEM
ncbi:MAG: tRNA-dihydrouridine synthase family protein [Lachnospiraceae bacterium]|nr:tRNA-dihydrouridine synthase family protein [Lachnospiraceae bacterium]